MRSVNKSIQIKKYIEIDEVIDCEEIVLITENKINKTIVAEVAIKNGEKTLDLESYYISNEKYDLLMSEKPEFAVNKPVNEYREADLWHIIDLIRNTQ